jgi:hypothetical protein
MHSYGVCIFCAERCLNSHWQLFSHLETQREAAAIVQEVKGIVATARSRHYHMPRFDWRKGKL